MSISAKKSIVLFNPILFLCLTASLILCACGSDSGGGDGDSNNKYGSYHCQISQVTTSATGNMDIKTVNNLDCNSDNVETIRFSFYLDGAEYIDSKSYPCNQSAVTINNIKPASGLTVVVTAEDTLNEVILKGQENNVYIGANDITTCKLINLKAVSSDDTDTATDTTTDTDTTIEPNPNNLDETFDNDYGMAFNLAVAGTFIMGSPEDEVGRNTDELQHIVNITTPFYIQTTEVTQAQWTTVMGANPSNYQCGDNCPVESVSYNDILSFITTLNQLDESRSGVYALPTEAQWEYAARAGSTTALSSGDNTVLECDADDNLDVVGWYCGNSEVTYEDCADITDQGGPDCAGTHEVAQKQANDWGLYDMHGNVQEWCRDWYNAGYERDPVNDPEGPTTGSERILRGGSYYNYAQIARSANRNSSDPDDTWNNVGFRLIFIPIID